MANVTNSIERNKILESTITHDLRALMYRTQDINFHLENCENVRRGIYAISLLDLLIRLTTNNWSLDHITNEVRKINVLVTFK